MSEIEEPGRFRIKKLNSACDGLDVKGILLDMADVDLLLSAVADTPRP